jgi:hypothetical protein
MNVARHSHEAGAGAPMQAPWPSSGGPLALTKPVQSWGRVKANERLAGREPPLRFRFWRLATASIARRCGVACVFSPLPRSPVLVRSDADPHRPHQCALRGERWASRPDRFACGEQETRI